MEMRRRRSQAVYAKRREMVSKFWAKIPPKYQGRLVGLFLFVLVIWSMWSVWDVSRH
jgi:type II secretory pathway component PulM